MLAVVVVGFACGLQAVLGSKIISSRMGNSFGRIIAPQEEIFL
jgi:hypothetical protein